MIAFCCPQCRGEFQISASLAGQQAVCPLCRSLVTVKTEESPAELEATAPEVESATTPSVNCPHCEVDLPIHPAQLNQEVACPACLHRIVLRGGAAGPVFTKVTSEPPREGSSPPEPHSQQADKEAAGSQETAEQSAEQESLASPSEEQTADTEVETRLAATTDTASSSDDSTSSEFLVHDSPRTVQVGNRVVELHTRTRKERSQLRFRKNIIMLIGSIAVLAAALLYLSGVFQIDSQPADQEQSVDPSTGP